MSIKKNYIYVYETPNSASKGLIKIGQTSKNPVTARIEQQLSSAAVHSKEQLTYTLLYECEAIRTTNPNESFTDKDLHKILKSKGVNCVTFKGKDRTEWFEISKEKVIHLIDCVKKGLSEEQISLSRTQSFSMRPEQAEAVAATKQYFKNAETANTPKQIDMLWNAKMRFGKTFSTYKLMLEMDLDKLLIITYKPAVKDAWQKDLESHVDFKDCVFLTGENLSKINYYLANNKKVVGFASYQDLLGESKSAEIKKKHEELFKTEWDLVAIDEFHYGSATANAQTLHAEESAEQASEDDEILEEEDETLKLITVLNNKIIKTKYRLFLSGTPFKALKTAQFGEEAIFNWTYVDEQSAKNSWIGGPLAEDNPYRTLPCINMLLLKVDSDILKEGLKEGKDEFSLNHFFRTKADKFEAESSVKAWLDALCGRYLSTKTISSQISDEEDSQYRDCSYKNPFDRDSDIYPELNHTVWYLNRVSSAKALKKLLETHPIFGNNNYKIVLAAGSSSGAGAEAISPVTKAISENKKTITLTVGKLTTGVSIPEWTGILFLRDTDSAENYFQAGFRVQTPWVRKSPSGKEIFLKKNCYILDFAPNRALKLLTTYSEKLSKDSLVTTSVEKITEFIRYFPVLKIENNKMLKLSPTEVLTFDLSGIDALGLGSRFVNRSNINVSNAVLLAIESNQAIIDKCQLIFDKIKAYKKFTGASDEEVKKSYDVDFNLAKLNPDIKGLKTKKIAMSRKEKEAEKKSSENRKKESELKKKKEAIINLMKLLLSRIPLYMYLTDATEQNLGEVVVEDNNQLFKKTTGISPAEFNYLVEVGFIKVESIEGYIIKFLELENKNFNLINKAILNKDCNA